MIKVRKIKSFDGVGLNSSIRRIKEYLIENAHFSVELSEAERTIKLNIPFSEMYHKCTIKEWGEIKQIIKKLTAKG